MKTRTRTKMLLLLGVLLFGFTVSAWSQKVSLNFNNEKVEKILSSIKAQTGMGLVFSDQLIDVNRKISIQVKDASLDEALSKLLAGTKVTFEIKNNKIYFIEKKADQQSGSRKKKVSGVVKDATGEPIIGANVVRKRSRYQWGDNKSGWGIHTGSSGKCFFDYQLYRLSPTRCVDKRKRCV